MIKLCITKSCPGKMHAAAIEAKQDQKIMQSPLSSSSQLKVTGYEQLIDHARVVLPENYTNSEAICA